MRLPIIISLIAALAAVLHGGAARADDATQVLALLAAPEGVPVQCADNRCTVELATLCLQPERLAPDAGQSYAVGRTDRIELMVRTADGGMTARPLPAGAGIEALRTHVAVRLSFPATAAGAIAGIRIAGATLLLPTADGAGRGAADVEQAERERLPLLQRILADDGDRRHALTLSRRLINSLSDDTNGAGYDRTWQRQTADLRRDGDDWQLAQVQHDFCRYSIDKKLYVTPADCLRAQQDDVLQALHNRFVEALSIGS